jgi:hypothetical protein
MKVNVVTEFTKATKNVNMKSARWIWSTALPLKIVLPGPSNAMILRDGWEVGSNSKNSSDYTHN